MFKVIKTAKIIRIEKDEFVALFQNLQPISQWVLEKDILNLIYLKCFLVNDQCF